MSVNRIAIVPTAMSDEAVRWSWRRRRRAAIRLVNSVTSKELDGCGPIWLPSERGRQPTLCTGNLFAMRA